MVQVGARRHPRHAPRRVSQHCPRLGLALPWKRPLQASRSCLKSRALSFVGRCPHLLLHPSQAVPLPCNLTSSAPYGNAHTSIHNLPVKLKLPIPTRQQSQHPQQSRSAATPPALCTQLDHGAPPSQYVSTRTLLAHSDTLRSLRAHPP